MFAESLVQARETMLSQILELIASTPPPPGMPPMGADESRQFIAGFLHIAIEAAKGNEGPREEYVALVVPSVKQAGIPLSIVMSGMLQIALGGAGVLDGDARRDWGLFCIEHTSRVCRAWEAA